VGSLEREIKLRFDSVDDARRAVARLGAAPARPRRLQEDLLLDTAAGVLLGRGCLLRIRRDGDANALTWKGPVLASEMKLREEFETNVGDSQTALRIFGELGFEPRFRYQKYREEFLLDGLTIAIDETPLGVFVELEGNERAIAQAAAGMGRGPGDYVRASYRTLFIEHQRARGLPDGQMVFDGL
jgi:adenylate cyclase, class 2